MVLKLVKETEKDIYDEFVAGHPSGSFLQSWEWGMWQESLGRKIARFWIEDAGAQQIGSIQLIRMPLPFGQSYWYAPYGPVFDGKYQESNNKYQITLNDLSSKFLNAVFVRLEPKVWHLDLGSWNLPIQKSVNIQPGKTLLLNLQKPEEELLSGMHPKTRYNIKVAQRHGVTIQDEFGITVDHGLYFKEAINLLVETGRRQGFANYPAKYFEKMVDFFAVQNPSQLKLHVYKAIYQNKLLASAIFLDYGLVRTFLFGGSSEKDRNVMAPYALHWQAILDAKTLGLKTYDFWGSETAAGDLPGFVRFKLGFAPQSSLRSSSGEKTYAGAQDLIVRPWAYRVYRLFRWANRKLR